MMKEEIQQQQQKLDRKRKEGAEKSCVDNPGTFLGCGNKWSLFAELKLLVNSRDLTLQSKTFCDVWWNLLFK